MNIDGYTIFCDDIREEVGGKRSFMGVYTGTLVIHGDFPVILPKFCMSVSLILERDIRKIEDYVLYVQLPGKEEHAFEADVKMKDVVKSVTDGRLNESDDGGLRIGANIIISPLQIDEPGFIRVRANQSGGAIMKLGSLKVVAAA